MVKSVEPRPQVPNPRHLNHGSLYQRPKRSPQSGYITILLPPSTMPLHKVAWPNDEQCAADTRVVDALD
jgi:hypothetical protein